MVFLNVAKLDFRVFSRYLATFKKIIQKKKYGDQDGVEDRNVVMDTEDIHIRLSASSFDSSCSSLAHLYHDCHIDREVVSKELWRKLGTYKKGSRREAARERKKLGLSMTEGKKHLPFAAYRYLAGILFTSASPEHVPAHTFLVMEWNLMSRSEYVVDSKIDLVSFEKDALLFDMGKTKTDQEGTKNVDHPWHVYSNSEHPEICPHLAMARHIIANPVILNGQCNLFEGAAQYKRFNAIFNNIVGSDKYADKFATLGIPFEFFGTHSIRKGAATHVATGSTACPPIASICLRANWAMPGVLNRYIKYEAAGDQFVGKCVSGRKRTSTEFAASPAYFDFSALAARSAWRMKNS